MVSVCMTVTLVLWYTVSKRQEHHQAIYADCSLGSLVFGRPFVKRFALCYQTVVCLSCLSVLCVTLVYFVLYPNGWMDKMKLGNQVGLGPGHIVLDGDPASPPQRVTAPNFRPISAVAKWLDGLRYNLVWR